MSREFTRLELLAFLWINMERKQYENWEFIQHYIHNINIVHRHGTCLEASAFREFKNTNKYGKSMTSSIIHIT